MTAEIFLTSLRKLASAGLERLPASTRTADGVKEPAHPEPATRLADIDVETGTYAAPVIDRAAAASVYQGMPVPVVSDMRPETLNLLLNSIISRIDKPSSVDSRQRESPLAALPAKTTASESELRPNVGVVETVYVDGVPKTSAVIATDDRARLAPEVDTASDAAASEMRKDVAARDPGEAQSATVVEDPTHRAEGPGEDMLPPLRDLATALSGLSVPQFDSSATSVVIFNAAMIPGWPTAFLLQAGRPLDDRREISAEKRAELIAKLMAEMGIEPLTEAELREMRRKPSIRLLRRIALVLSAILVSFSGVAQDLADIKSADSALGEVGQRGPTVGKTRKRLYLE